MQQQTAFPKLNLKLSWTSITIVTCVLIFLATRLVNLTSFPIFGDETSYIRYAQLTAKGDLFAGLRASLRLTHIWLIVVALRLFSDPLLAARVGSVVSGLIGCVICYKLATMLYPGRRIGYITALFYLLSPFSSRNLVPSSLFAAAAI